MRTNYPTRDIGRTFRAGGAPMADNIVPFRRAKLSGFIPEDAIEPAPALPALMPVHIPIKTGAEPIADDSAPCEMPPEST